MAARRSQEKPGAARSSQQQPGAARSIFDGLGIQEKADGNKKPTTSEGIIREILWKYLWKY